MEEKKDDRPDPVNFGEIIKKIRTDKDLTLKAAAESTGIAEAYLWQLENGERKSPRPETIKKLADGYGIPVQHLLACAGYMPTKEETKQEVEQIKKTHLFRDYQKLSDTGKKELENYLQYLKGKDTK
jgi:HTH-type transcriptional regulator, competence development regulator